MSTLYQKERTSAKISEKQVLFFIDLGRVIRLYPKKILCNYAHKVCGCRCIPVYFNCCVKRIYIIVFHKMSKHPWLYRGINQYEFFIIFNSSHMQKMHRNTYHFRHVPIGSVLIKPFTFSWTMAPLVVICKTVVLTCSQILYTVHKTLLQFY